MPALVGIKTLGSSFKNEKCLERVTYDFAVDGGAVGTYDLFTAGTDIVITNFYAYVKTACTSGGAATAALGVTGTTSMFVNTTGGAVANLTANAVLKPLYTEGTPNTFSMPLRLASGSKVLMTVATAALTAGKIEFVIEYTVA